MSRPQLVAYDYYDLPLEVVSELSSTKPTRTTHGDDHVMGVARFLSSEEWTLTQLLAFGIALVLIFVSNILLMLVIRRVRYLKTSSNRYVIALAVVDLVMGAYSGLRIVAAIAPRSLGNIYMCLSVQLGWVCLATVSQVLVLFLAFDSYFALWHPIKYNQVLTPWKANVTIVLAWLYGATIAIVPLMWLIFYQDQQCHIEDVIIKRYLLFLSAHYVATLGVALLVFLFIHYEIHTSKVVLKVYKKRRKQRQVYEERRKKDVQNAHCMTVVVTSYYAFWLPYFVANSLVGLYERSAALTLFESLSVMLVVLHSSLNPLIYVCRLKTFQVACYRVFCCFTRRHFPKRPPSTNIQLRSLSFRNHATGSMMSLHTNMASDGKMVKLPVARCASSITADVSHVHRSASQSRDVVTKINYSEHDGALSDDVITDYGAVSSEDEISVWVTSRRKANEDMTSPRQREVYRKRAARSVRGRDSVSMGDDSVFHENTDNESRLARREVQENNVRDEVDSHSIFSRTADRSNTDATHTSDHTALNNNNEPKHFY